MPPIYVVDTNTFIAWLKKDGSVRRHLEAALLAEAQLLLCPVVDYELRRELIRKKAEKQLLAFDLLISTLTLSEVVIEDWREAAKEWSELRDKNVTIGDPDILIGIYARRRGAIVVTDNTKDFVHLSNVKTENWQR